MTRRIFILLIVLVFSALACAQPMQPTEPPPTRVPPSTQDAEALKVEVATASAKFAQTGQLSITFTEQQLTAFLIEGLSTQTDFTLTEPQVILQDGQIKLSGKILLGESSIDITMVLVPTVQDGKVTLSVASANFGILPIPEKLLTQITDTINQKLMESITFRGRKLVIEKVEIANGALTILGKSR